MLIQTDGDTTRTYQEQRNFLIQSHVRDIQFKKQEILYVEEELTGMMKLLDCKIDTVTAAYLVAEIGDVKRFANASKLARFAGIAPVMFSSAGKGSFQKSKQGNRTLHGLFYNLAVQQVQVSKGNKLERNPIFNAYFKLKQAEGKTKGQALVCIMRRLVNIIYGMMKNKTEYVVPPLVEKVAG
jgi:transposase